VTANLTWLEGMLQDRIKVLVDKCSVALNYYNVIKLSTAIAYVW